MNKRQKEALRGKFSDALMSTGLMVSTISEWYDAKHRKPSKEEVDFINSIAIEECPFCGSREIRRDGFSKRTGLAIRECKACGRKFNPLAGTIFDSRKIPFSEWIEFLVHLFQFHSVRTAAFDNRNAVTTGLYWLSKVFLVVDGVQSGIVFSGKVWIDETYFPRWKSESAAKNGRLLRGLSRNQFCVCSATDGKRCALYLCGVGKPSSAKALRAYGGVIARGSTVASMTETIRTRHWLKALALKKRFTRQRRQKESRMIKIPWSRSMRSIVIWRDLSGRTAASQGKSSRDGSIFSGSTGTHTEVRSKRLRHSSNRQ